MNWFNDIKVIQNLLHTTIGEKKIVNHLFSHRDTIFCLDFPTTIESVIHLFLIRLFSPVDTIFCLDFHNTIESVIHHFQTKFLISSSDQKL